MSTVIATNSEFEWDKAKTECLELLLKGVPKLEIARRLSVHRNTVNNWCANPHFMREVNARMAELRETSTFKRSQQAGLFADIAGKNALKAAKDLDNDPQNENTRRRFRDFTDEWRRNTQAEREVLGVNIQRVESRSTVSGSVRHTHDASDSFKDLLLKAAKTKAIDTKVIENAENPMAAVQGAVRALLTAGDGELLNKMHQQDKETEMAEKGD